MNQNVKMYLLLCVGNHLLAENSIVHLIDVDCAGPETLTSEN